MPCGVEILIEFCVTPLNIFPTNPNAINLCRLEEYASSIFLYIWMKFRWMFIISLVSYTRHCRILKLTIVNFNLSNIVLWLRDNFYILIYYIIDLCKKLIFFNSLHQTASLKTKLLYMCVCGRA